MDAYNVEKIQSFKRLGMKIGCTTAFGKLFILYTHWKQFNKSLRFIFWVLTKYSIWNLSWNFSWLSWLLILIG